MIMSTMVVPIAYDSVAPRVPNGKLYVIASNESRPPPEASDSTVPAARGRALLRPRRQPSLSHLAGSWNAFRVASRKTTCVTSWTIVVSR